MTQSFLMCSPDYFGVHYSINPWMADQIGSVDISVARQQWENFHSTLKEFAKIQLMEPQPHVPDLVFTANAGLILGNKFIPSRFRHQERRDEEPCFRAWFQSQKYQMVDWPESIFFEGAGDALMQPEKNLLWAANGFRTDPEAHHLLASESHLQVVSLQLMDARFYHLDTCFCPLQKGKVMYFPQAFTKESLNLIEENIAPENRIIVSEDDALHFACNAVLVDRNIIMNHAGKDLKKKLQAAGYTVFINPVTEFLKAGGANKCLTLELNSLQGNEMDLKEMDKVPVAMGSQS